MIQREADFYGSMDGASKFIKGDAIAGILIVVIDFIGGLLIGMFQRNLDFQQAMNLYTLLTVGDGLVSQIPALLISTATGIVVTRAASENNLGHDLNEQLLNNPKVLAVTSGVLLLLPLFQARLCALFHSEGLFGTIAHLLWRSRLLRKLYSQTQAIQEQDENASRKVCSLLQVDQIELEIGYSPLPWWIPIRAEIRTGLSDQWWGKG